MGIFETPEACIERIRAYQQDYKMGRLICWFNPGGMVPHDRVMRSMELFAERVMPHFQD
jgi:alkanesulfonate monooxygenase SsuD/methylene tetrahydromethanopterin reductase-like flavin-dependent oxidoreductase (luciferase family)